MKCEDCPVLLRARSALLSQGIDLQNAEVELRALRRRITALQVAAAKRRDDDQFREDAQRVFDYWRTQLHPKAREFGGKRLQAVLDRLHGGYSVADLKEAIDGAKADAYVNAKGVRFDDLELVCRDAVHTDRFMDRATRAVTHFSDPAILREALRDGLAELWGVAIVDQDWELWPCPACSPDPPTHRPLKVAPVSRDPWVWCNECDTPPAMLLKRLARRLSET